MKKYEIKIRYFLGIIMIMIVIISCKQDKGHPRHNDLERIVFATGGCFGTCPFSAIEIDSSLKYKFYGGKYSLRSGFYTGNITQELWDSLNIKLEKIKYKQLDSCYSHSVDDLAMEVILFFNGQSKHFSAQSASLPDSVYRCFSWILKTQNRIHLVSSKDSLKFKTFIQEAM
jgi:hypothetical protein